MRRNQLFISLLLSFAASAHAAGDRVFVPSFSHLPRASNVKEIYEAQCGDIRYKLAAVRDSRSVILERSGLAPIDLSRTSFASVLLDRRAIVRVGFNCPMGAINLFLHGVQSGTPLRAVDVATSVRENGVINEDEGIRYQPVEESDISQK
jgi:hypothetical protein